MDRTIVTPSSLVQDTDILALNKNMMLSVGRLATDMLGVGTSIGGAACTPGTGLTVSVAPGGIYSYQNVDNTAYGSLPADTAHQTLKQGALFNAVTLACPAPTGAGQSINYLIEGQFQEADVNPVVVPYYNSANPIQPFQGPGNNGLPQNTLRQGLFVVQVKAGVAAATGSQVTPTVDGGWTVMYVVTVDFGESSLTVGDIVVATGAPFIGVTALNALSQALAATLYLPLYGVTAAEIAAVVTPTNTTYPELNILRYGADPTGVASSDTAISNALLVACPLSGAATNARYIYFPAGQYLITTTINCTNTRVGGTRIKDGLKIKGDGVGATFFIGKTGAGQAVIETTGAQWLTIEDLNIFTRTADAAAQSTVGIFQGIGSTLQQTQNQTFRRVNVQMTDQVGVNGGAGSVAIWNFGAEENTYDTVYLTANLPRMFTTQNPSQTGFTTPTSYQTLLAAHSLGVTTFTGECFVCSVNKRQPSTITEGVGSWRDLNTYMSNVGGTAGTNQSAWKVYGALNGAEYEGLIESHARVVEVIGVIQRGKFNVTFGNIDSAATEMILLDRAGNQGQLQDCEFNITNNSSPTNFTTRNLIVSPPNATNDLTSQFIQGCIFRVNSDKQYTTIQENTLWNPNTGNVTIEALHNSTNGYRYTIDANRTQEVAIPETACLINGGITQAEIVRLIYPTVVSSANAIAMDVFIEGILRINGATTAAMSVKYISTHVSVALSNTGSAFTSADAIFSGTTANVSPTGNNITGAVVSAALNPAYTQIVCAPTRTGANNETVNFVGTARMRWAGNESRAPSLQTLS